MWVSSLSSGGPPLDRVVMGVRVAQCRAGGNALFGVGGGGDLIVSAWHGQVKAGTCERLAIAAEVQGLDAGAFVRGGGHVLCPRAIWR